MFVPSSDRCIVCHMYNWCVQVRCTCVCVCVACACVCVCVVVYKKIRHTIVYRAMYATMQVCAQVGASMSSCTMCELKVVRPKSLQS